MDVVRLSCLLSSAMEDENQAAQFTPPEGNDGTQIGGSDAEPAQPSTDHEQLDEVREPATTDPAQRVIRTEYRSKMLWRIAVFVVGVVLTLFPLSLQLARYIMMIVNECFFPDPADAGDATGEFERFKQSADVCDMSVYLQAAMSLVLSVSWQLGLAEAALTLIQMPFLVVILLMGTVAWLIVMVITVVLMLAFQFPFWEYTFPLIIVIALLVLSLIFAALWRSTIESVDITEADEANDV